jgi:uncharacterized protein YhjY with autotransporter beta-barrel domain
MAPDTIVRNHEGAMIRGGWDGISFNNRETISLLDTVDNIDEGASVFNDGRIVGTGNGISGGMNLTIENHATGAITGVQGNGIYAGDNLTLINEGAILGVTESRFLATKSFRPIYYKQGSAVQAGARADITNSGTIIGAYGNGISAFDDLKLVNSGKIEGNGITTYFIDSEEIVYAAAPLPSAFGSGVLTGANAAIDNEAEGSISGSFNGITAGSFLNLKNAGEITASSDAEGGGNAGVQAGGGAVIVNTGLIKGDLNGIVIGESELPPVEFDTFLAPEAAPDLSSIISNEGSITGTTGTGIIGSVQAETVNNKNGWITGGIAAIDLAGGDDIINLGFGSVVQGNIAGGEGFDVINFTSGSESITDESNIVHGNVGGIETINKTGPGFAFIGGSGESFNVFTDTINVSSGGLVINGNLASLAEGKTAVNLTGGGRLDGTGSWNADLFVTEGGISAGGTNNELTGSGKASALSAAKTADSAGYLDSVGTLTLNGNFNGEPVIVPPTVLKAQSVSSPAFIREDIVAGKAIVNGVNSDLIVQNGSGNTFNVAGMDIRLAPTDINLVLTDGTYTIVDSDSPLAGVGRIGKLGVLFGANVPDTGDFVATESGDNNRNTVVGSYFAKIETGDPAAGGGDSNLLVTVKHDYQGLPGLTDNQAALASALDAAVDSPNADIQDFIAAMDYSDLDTVQATLAALDPGSTMGLADLVVNGNYRLHRLTQNHLAAIRGTSRETSEAAAPVTDSKGAVVTSPATSRVAGRGNAWGSVSYDGQDYDAPGNPADFDGDSGAFTAGVDWLVAPQLVLGLVLDGSKGNYDGTGTDSDVDSFRGAVYGTWGGGMGFYSDFLAGYGDHNLESDADTAGVLTGKIRSETDADSFQALWTAGYTMGDARLKHGPFAGFEYQNVDVDGFTQGGQLPVQVGGFDVDSLRALIGYRVNANLGMFRPYASAVYAHEFEDGANSATASFGGTSFKVSGAEQSSAILLGIGTGIALSDSLTLDVGYRGDIAVDDGLTSHGASLGLNYSF